MTTFLIDPKLLKLDRLERALIRNALENYIIHNIKRGKRLAKDGPLKAHTDDEVAAAEDLMARLEEDLT